MDRQHITPEAGKDYEVSLDVADGRCMALINEIADAADGSVQLHPVDVAPAKRSDAQQGRLAEGFRRMGQKVGWGR